MRDNDSQERDGERYVIVCVCNGLGERQVKSASRNGPPTACPVAAYARLGCKPKCGQCLNFAREVLRAA